MPEIKIKNLDKIIEAYKKAPELMTKEIGDAVESAIYFVQRTVTPMTPIGVSSASRSGWTAKFGGKRLVGTLYNAAKQALFAHEGTKPHFPPWKGANSVEPWAIKRGINPFVLARSISRKGTKANPFLTQAVDQSGNEINSYFNRALASFTNQMAVK